METVKFLFMQVTAVLLIVFQFFVIGAAFGAGAWVVWRALDRRASRPRCDI
jgi:succinate dehydrogenase hydrophobic anchor subunit